ncbi:hypothetical protein [Noviherbaspirillum humi]|uniref:hypothetical protein n=1 Tax=Noviherbaspirillum humi TaxID=1688639 RepID=UPI0011603C0E|nr:hypothetical protein [Noviherbaspirillum humi]
MSNINSVNTEHHTLFETASQTPNIPVSREIATAKQIALTDDQRSDLANNPPERVQNAIKAIGGKIVDVTVYKGEFYWIFQYPPSVDPHSRKPAADTYGCVDRNGRLPTTIKFKQRSAIPLFLYLYEKNPGQFLGKPIELI